MTTAGERVSACGFESCGWQALDAPDSRVFRHMAEEHGGQLAGARAALAAERGAR